jgi:hypothetical protein
MSVMHKQLSVTAKEYGLKPAGTVWLLHALPLKKKINEGSCVRLWLTVKIGSHTTYEHCFQKYLARLVGV